MLGHLTTFKGAVEWGTEVRMNDWIDFKMIKQRVTFEEVLKHYDIRLRQVNQFSLRGKCPLPTHSSDKSNGSFGVHLGKNIWSCQSTSCAGARDGKKGGNVIDFVAAMENTSIHEAAKQLQNWFLSNPAEIPHKETDPRRTVATKTDGERSGEETNKPLSFKLKDIDPTHSYLKERGIKEETLTHFGVGFFPGRGSMSGRVVIPISNERGELVAYAGRSIDATEPKYKFPAGFKKSEVLFNLDRVLALPPEFQNPLIVVEGFFDCMSVHQAGLPAVVALMGSSLSEAQEKLLCRFKQVILFLDGDEAGQLATGSIAARLISQTFVKAVRLSDGKQPDQLSSDEIKTALSL